MMTLWGYEFDRRGSPRSLKTIKEALIDKEDEWLLEKFSWRLDSRGYIATSICFNKTKHVLLHRVILGVNDGYFTDHINRNKLDNRKINLRIVTQELNAQNRNLNSNNTSGYRGVSYTSKYPINPWLAYAQVNKRQYRIGYFSNAEEAGLAAHEWRLQHMPGAVD